MLRRRLMINLRAAFDASMDQPCGITTVAGYIAGQDQWLEVERRWNGHLAIAGLEYFHLREIKNRYPRHWTKVVEPFAKVIEDARRAAWPAINCKRRHLEATVSSRRVLNPVPQGGILTSS